MSVTAEPRAGGARLGLPDTPGLVWLGLLALTLGLLAMRGSAGWVLSYPDSWVLPVADWLDGAMDWFIAAFGWVFRWLSGVLGVLMDAVRDLLHVAPWSVLSALCVYLAWAVSGWRLALFAVFACAYMVVTGYWDESMNSLALVAVSVPVAIAIGFAVGAIGYRSAAARGVIVPALDLLQTVPAFAYLLPILLLFGFGPVVGMIASVLYAFPPMVRNTMLGLSSVPAEILESGQMSGATPTQLFWQVRVPNALRQLLLGLNQTTMAAFSMVIIASIIGGTADIGWEVLQHIRRAEVGESLLAGLVIALMAMVMDRITHAIALNHGRTHVRAGPLWRRHPHWLAAAAIAAALWLLSLVLPPLHAWPAAWVWYPAEPLNASVEWLVRSYTQTIQTIKAWAFFYLMLPVKAGLENTISPFSWGWEFTFARKLIYLGLALALTAAAWVRLGERAAIAAAWFFVLIYFGVTGLPWAPLIAVFVWMGWRLGGAPLAAGTAFAVGFLAVSGIWDEAMLSLYLTGIAVVLSFVIGTAIGILASESEAVSRVVRPICDTLQTMPLFVLLIPFVMIFKIGEFTALLSIIAYAIVPSIRYAEHGLRNVPQGVIEPAECIGCTRWQLLWQVKVPLAMPVIMLGLNQTIMYAIAMLVIAALVGTSGLGQLVYIGLSDGDFGVGMVAGLGMAMIAMTADRMTQALSEARRRRFGQ